MKNSQTVKKIWVITILAVVFKLTLATALWSYLRHYLSAEALSLLGIAWLAKLALVPILVPLVGLLTVRFWRNSKKVQNQA